MSKRHALEVKIKHRENVREQMKVLEETKKKTILDVMTEHEDHV